MVEEEESKSFGFFFGAHWTQGDWKLGRQINITKWKPDDMIFGRF